MIFPHPPRLLLSSALLLSACLPTASARAGSNADNVPNPDPKVQQADFIVPEGYEINLFASDPMVRKPIQINWDRRGRLWVVCSTLYPQIKPGQQAKDEVVILEDTNRDGVADKHTVFAEGLHIPTAILPYGDGALVANSTELLWLHDKDGDDKVDPDGHQILLSGFGTEDTHHLIHTLRQGPDGKVYFNQSIYIHSHVETPFGVRRLMAGGVWMLDPASSRLEIISQGFVNAWGLEFARNGEAFAVDGAGGEGINHIFPGSNHVTSTVPNLPVLRGLNPGQPKLCGMEIIDSPHFPADWQGDMLANDFRGNRINRYKVTPKGSGYESTRMPDVLASKNRAFRPVDVRLGPDGALYIADFYNPIIQHGEVDFRDERRDHVHGRIWRLTAKAGKLLNPPNLQKAEEKTLWDLTAGEDKWSRHFARVELAARGVAQAWRVDAADPKEFALQRLMRQTTTPDAWEATVPDTFAGTNARERRWWIHYASRGFIERQSEVARRSVELLPRILRVFDEETDNLIDFALASYCRKTSSTWLPALQDGRLKIENPAHLVYALKNSGDARALGLLVDPLLDGKLPKETAAAVWKLAAEQADGAFLKRLFDAAPDAGVGADVLTALSEAARQRKAKPSGDLSRIVTWITDAKVEAPLRGQAAELAGLWGHAPARPALNALVADAAAPAEARAGALRGLAALGGAESTQTLTAFAAQPGDAALRGAAVRALLSLDAGAAANAAVDLLATAGTPALAQELTAAFTQAKGGPVALAAALKGKTIPEPVAAAAFRTAGSAGLRDNALPDALRAAGGLQPVAQALTPEQVTALVAKVRNEGDAVRGEAVYHREGLLCTFCHAIGEAGGIIGPNIQSLGASAQIDYVIDSLLQPSNKIKEGYHTTTVTTKDNQVFAGMLVKDAEEVVIRDAAGTEHRVGKAQVASKEISPVSLMPPGLTASLTEPEFVDLVRFLSDLGREGGVKLPTAKFLHTWTADGRAVVSRVDGTIVVDGLAGKNLTTTVEQAAPGNLKIEMPGGGKLFLDEQPLPGGVRALPAGKHTLRLQLGPDARGWFRIEQLP